MREIDAATARHYITEIYHWKDGLTDTAETILGISSACLSFSTSPTNEGSLTAKVAATLDDPTLGAAGVRTEEGLQDVLTAWAESFAEDRGETTINTWAYLTTAGVLEWAREHADWEAFISDVKEIHTHLAVLTGHAPRPIGQCPRLTDNGRCGGLILAEETDHGRTDYGVCAKCEAWYADEEDIIRATAETMRIESRAVTDPLILVCVGDLANIWEGDVDKNTIKAWIKRGHIIPRDIDRDGHRLYSLAEANRVIATRLERDNRTKLRND